MDFQLLPERPASTGSGRYPPGAAEDAEMLAQLVADGRVSREIGVTVQSRTDGAGAQAISVVSAMALARFAGCRYLHSPFRIMSHAPGAKGNWARLWEQFFNFGDGEIPVQEDAESVRLSTFVRDPTAYVGRKIVIANSWFKLPAGQAEGIREALRNELRAKYWRSPKTSIRSHHARRGFTVAVHLRRGDVSATRHAQRYVPDDDVLRQIGRLRRALAPLRRPVIVNLYSEGAPEDFRAFTEAGCTLHIRDDPFETFHNLVTADILVIGHSSFSRLAALLSQGIILADENRDLGLSNYLCRRANGDIPIKPLRHALAGRMHRWERLLYRIRRHWRAS